MKNDRKCLKPPSDLGTLTPREGRPEVKQSLRRLVWSARVILFFLKWLPWQIGLFHCTEGDAKELHEHKARLLSSAVVLGIR
jgi:hypothetical protein